MVNPFSWLKYRLSHVRENSWHFQAARGIWEHRAYGKACTYYWFKLPSALFLWFVMCFFFVLVCVVGAFFGFVPTLFPASEEMRHHQRSGAFYPYKTLPNGKRFRVAPWEIVAGICFIFVVYYLAMVDQALGLWVGEALLAFIAFCVFIFVISKGWVSPPIRNARLSLKAALSGVCPDLEVE